MEPAGTLVTTADLQAEIELLRVDIRDLAPSQRDYQKTVLLTVGAMTALTTIFSVIIGLFL